MSDEPWTAISETHEQIDVRVYTWYDGMTGSMDEIVSRFQKMDRSFRSLHNLSDTDAVTYTLEGEWEESIVLRAECIRPLSEEKKRKKRYYAAWREIDDAYNDAVKDGKNVHEQRRIRDEKMEALEAEYDQ